MTDQGREPFRLFRPTYKGPAGERREVDKWWIETRAHLSIVRRFPGLPDKAQPKALARLIVRLVAYRLTGEQPGPELVRWLQQVPPEAVDAVREDRLVG